MIQDTTKTCNVMFVTWFPPLLVPDCTLSKGGIILAWARYLPLIKMLLKYERF